MAPESDISSDRELVGQMQRIQLTIGDHALEIEPVQPNGGAHPASGEEPFGVNVSLRDWRLAAETLTNRVCDVRR